MRSIKTKLFSLGMAASMLLALGGCAMSTPANVGTIDLSTFALNKVYELPIELPGPATFRVCLLRE